MKRFNEDSCCIGLSGNNTMRLLNNLELFEMSQRNYHCSMYFTNSYPAGIGVIYDSYEPMCIFLGSEDLLTDALINDMQVLESFRGFYHELRHADHKVTKFEVCDNYKSEMKIDYIACDKNPTVAGMRYNMDPADDYWNNIRELDCEYYAFEKTYELLQNKNIFPGIKDPEDLMVRYMNTKLFDVVNDIPFPKNNTFLRVDKPFESIDDIRSAYNNAIDKSVVRGNKNYDLKYDNNSELSRLFKSGNWSNAYSKLHNNQDGNKRTKMIASVMLNLHPEYKTELDITEDELSMLDFEKLYETKMPKISVLTKFKLNKEVEDRQKRIEDELSQHFNSSLLENIDESVEDDDFSIK